MLLRMRPGVSTARIKLLIITSTNRHAGNLKAAREPPWGVRAVAKTSQLISSRCWRKRTRHGLVDVKVGRRG